VRLPDGSFPSESCLYTMRRGDVSTLDLFFLFPFVFVPKFGSHLYIGKLLLWIPGFHRYGLPFFLSFPFCYGWMDGWVGSVQKDH
jgi:hypothetical protein